MQESPPYKRRCEEKHISEQRNSWRSLNKPPNNSTTWAYNSKLYYNSNHSVHSQKWMGGQQITKLNSEKHSGNSEHQQGIYANCAPVPPPPPPPLPMPPPENIMTPNFNVQTVSDASTQTSITPTKALEIDTNSPEGVKLGKNVQFLIPHSKTDKRYMSREDFLLFVQKLQLPINRTIIRRLLHTLDERDKANGSCSANSCKSSDSDSAKSDAKTSPKDLKIEKSSSLKQNRFEKNKAASKPSASVSECPNNSTKQLLQCARGTKQAANVDKTKKHVEVESQNSSSKAAPQVAAVTERKLNKESDVKPLDKAVTVPSKDQRKVANQQPKQHNVQVVSKQKFAVRDRNVPAKKLEKPQSQKKQLKHTAKSGMQNQAQMRTSQHIEHLANRQAKQSQVPMHCDGKHVNKAEQAVLPVKQVQRTRKQILKGRRPACCQHSHHRCMYAHKRIQMEIASPAYLRPTNVRGKWAPIFTIQNYAHVFELQIFRFYPSRSKPFPKVEYNRPSDECTSFEYLNKGCLRNLPYRLYDVYQTLTESVSTFNCIKCEIRRRKQFTNSKRGIYFNYNPKSPNIKKQAKCSAVKSYRIPKTGDRWKKEFASYNEIPPIDNLMKFNWCLYLAHFYTSMKVAHLNTANGTITY